MIPTSNVNRDRDQMDQDTPLDPRLITDLQTAYRRSPPLDAVDGAIRHAVEARVVQRAAPERSGKGRRLLPRLSVPVAALVMVTLGLGAFLHGQGPTPVSAQTVLHRAAAAGAGPNEATHATYRVSSSDGGTGTADVWIGYDGSGTAAELALTLTMSHNGSSGANVNAAMVEVGSRLLQVYNSADGPAQAPVPATPPESTSPTTTSNAPNPPGQVLKGMVVGTLLAQKLSKQPNAFTLKQETLDGVPVYALQPAGADGVTYYFNAQSYMLQGADWAQSGVSWQARLASSSTVPLSSVPTHTFTTTAGGVTTGSAGPDAGSGYGMGVSSSGSATSGAQVGGEATASGVSIKFSGGPSGADAHLTISTDVTGLKGSSVDLTPALATACNTTPQALATVMQTAARSILAVCQQTNASISADQLVTALLAPVQSALEGLVRSGTITASRESSDLASLRTRLAHLVTSGVGTRLAAPGPTGQQP